VVPSRFAAGARRASIASAAPSPPDEREISRRSASSSAVWQRWLRQASLQQISSRYPPQRKSSATPALARPLSSPRRLQYVSRQKRFVCYR